MNAQPSTPHAPPRTNRERLLALSARERARKLEDVDRLAESRGTDAYHAFLRWLEAPCDGREFGNVG